MLLWESNQWRGGAHHHPKVLLFKAVHSSDTTTILPRISYSLKDRHIRLFCFYQVIVTLSELPKDQLGPKRLCCSSNSSTRECRVVCPACSDVSVFREICSCGSAFLSSEGFGGMLATKHTLKKKIGFFFFFLLHQSFFYMMGRKAILLFACKKRKTGAQKGFSVRLFF